MDREITQDFIELKPVSAGKVPTPSQGTKRLFLDAADFGVKIIDDTKAIIPLGVGGNVADVEQLHTSGATLTVAAGTNVLFIDPATVISTLNLILPASLTHPSGVLTVYVGGTIVDGNPVVNSLTITASSGIVQSINIPSLSAGDNFSLKFRSSTSKYYFV